MKISFIIIRGGKIRLIIASIIMFYILLSCDIFVPRQMVISHKNNRTNALEINLTEKERGSKSRECALLLLPIRPYFLNPSFASSLFFMKRPPPGTRNVPETEYPNADSEYCVAGS